MALVVRDSRQNLAAAIHVAVAAMGTQWRERCHNNVREFNWL